MSIRLRFVLGITLIFLIGLTWMLHEIRSEARPRYKEAVEESLVEMANSMAAAASGGEKLNPTIIVKIFEDLRSRKLDARIYDVAKTDFSIHAYVTDDKGVVVYDSSDSTNVGKDFSRWNDVFRTLRDEYGARSTRGDPSDPGSSVLFVGAPIRSGSGSILGSVTVFKPTRAMEMYIQKSMREILKSGYLAGAGVVIVGILFSLAVTRPINGLVEYAQRNRNGERFALPRLSAPEFQRLGEAFEEMRLALEGRKEIEAYVQALTHEIKSPLTAIRGAGELLEEDMPRDERGRFLRNIRTESSRIQHIVDSLLNLAALEARKSLADVESIEVRGLIDEVLESLRPALLQKSLKVVVEAATGTIRGERFLVVQSLRNLVQNAVDFGPAGSLISVSAREERGLVVIDVVDEGPGLPDYAVGRVFERFYSLSRPETGKKSSGLGLSFVKEAAALHRGSVEIANRVDRSGVKAILRLPT